VMLIRKIEPASRFRVGVLFRPLVDLIGPERQSFVMFLIAAGSSVPVNLASRVLDDTQTTTTTTHHDGGPPAAYVGVPGVAGVQVGPGAGPRTGCETRNKTVTDDYTGETHSRTETNC
jgi:hypothetical protein